MRSREFLRGPDGIARPIRTGITGQNYPGKRNFPHPRAERTWTRQSTRPVASMPSVISSGSPTGPTKGMHPAALRNPARFSRKMSISDVGSGGHGKFQPPGQGYTGYVAGYRPGMMLSALVQGAFGFVDGVRRFAEEW